MKYEDMSVIQLKSLCQDRGLGTGRAKAELIAKLVSYDSRTPLKDIDLTENDIDSLMEGAEPVDLESAPQAEDSDFEDENARPKLFYVSFPHVGMLLDSDHDTYRRLTWEQAAEHSPPFGGPTTPRLVKAEGGYLTYEIEVS